MKGVASFSAFAALLSALTLTACGDGGDGPANQAESASRAEDTIKDLLDTIPERHRADVEARFTQFRQRLGEGFDRAAGLAGVERDRALANMAEFVVGERRHYQQRVEDYKADVEERIAKNDTINAENARAVLAEAQLQVAALDQFMAKIRGESAFADKAAEKLLASIDATGAPRLRMSGIVRDLEGQPCLFTKGQGARTTPFSMRGIELGMSRDAALAAICEAQKNDVRLVGEAKAVTFDDAYRLERGAQLAAMEDYRAGRGTFDQIFERTKSLLNGPVKQQVQSENRKEYLALTEICLGCEPGIDYNSMKALYLPNGQIYSLSRNANFVATVDEGGVKARRNAPQPLKAILDPLESQYGKPSFRYSDSSKAVYGWVFADRKNLLPLEDWRAFGRQLKPGWGGFSVPEILLNGSSIMTEKNVPSIVKLNARRPVATYCLVDSGLLTPSLFGNMAFDAVTYGAAARKWGGEMQLFVNGTPLMSTPYSRGMEGAGYVPKCGIVVRVVMTYSDAARARDPKLPPAPDDLVQKVDMTILDVDQDQGYAKYEARKIMDRQKSLDRSLDKASAATSFQP